MYCSVVAFCGARTTTRTVLAPTMTPGQLSPITLPPVSLDGLLINLLVGVVLAFVMRWHYVQFALSLTNRRSFAGNFYLIILTTTLIITVVKSSLALSLGLVGALSIVRFRTPIKEPEELTYLFLAIAIGLGLGASQTLATVVAAVFILTVIAIVRWSMRTRREKLLFLSISWPSGDGQKTSVERVTEVVSGFASEVDLRRVDVQDGRADTTYLIDLEKPQSLSDLIGELQQQVPGVAVTVIDQNHIPAV